LRRKLIGPTLGGGKAGRQISASQEGTAMKRARILTNPVKAVAGAALAAGMAVLNPIGAGAQGFPTRSVNFIVPWPAGGTTDVALRALATATERHFGQSFVIENRGGAGGTRG